MNEERHFHHAGEEVVSVTPSPIGSELFAVVRGEHHDALVVDSAALQDVDEAAEAAVHPVHPGGVARLEARIALPRRISACANRGDVKVQRPRVNEKRRGSGRHSIFCLGERVAEVERHLGNAAVQLVERGRRCQQLRHDVIARHEPLVAVRVEQLLERVHRPKRRHVLRVHACGAHPDRRNRKARAAVLREGAPEDDALAREVVDVRRERRARVVGAEVVRPQAVDHEQEDPRPCPRRRGMKGRDEVDVDGAAGVRWQAGIRAEKTVESGGGVRRRVQQPVREPERRVVDDVTVERVANVEPGNVQRGFDGPLQPVVGDVERERREADQDHRGGADRPQWQRPIEPLEHGNPDGARRQLCDCEVPIETCGSPVQRPGRERDGGERGSLDRDWCTFNAEDGVESGADRCVALGERTKSRTEPCGRNAESYRHGDEGSCRAGHPDAVHEQPLRRVREQRNHQQHRSGITPHEGCICQQRFDRCGNGKDETEQHQVVDNVPREADAEAGGKQIGLETVSDSDDGDHRVKERNEYRRADGRGEQPRLGRNPCRRVAGAPQVLCRRGDVRGAEPHNWDQRCDSHPQARAIVAQRRKQRVNDD